MRKIILGLLVISSLHTFQLSAQCNASKAKILLVGDSWANFANQFNSINKALDYYGYSDLEYFSNGDIAVNGTETKWMLEQGTINSIASALNTQPDIEIISVSIGGNDILGDAHTSMDTMQIDSLFLAILDRIDDIIFKLDSLKPGVKLYFTEYDFPNFEESINEYQFGSPSDHPFYDTWDGMGQPTYQRLNSILNLFHTMLIDRLTQYPNADFVSAAGLMQYVYGQSYNLPLGPSGTYAAGTAPVPGGFIDYPSPLESMNDYGFFYDSFHLSNEGFEFFYNYHFKHYFYNMLRSLGRDATFLSNGNGEDGYINNATTNTQQLALGTDGVNASVSVLSFNTATLLDSTIETASIFLKRDSLVGNQPLQSGKVLVSIKNGVFNGNPLLEAADLSAPADATDTACFYGVNDVDGNIIRIDLPTSLLGFVSTTGTTQIRISALGGIAGELFLSLSDTTFPASMDVKYETPSISSIDDQLASEPTLTIYPNPTNGDQLFVQTDLTIQSLTIVDTKGVRLTKQLTNGSVDVSDLSKGIYIIQLMSENQEMIQTKFIKL